jgi:transposase
MCVRSTYTIYTRVCGHPFKLVDSAISATPVADRCIKSSTQPCNLHRQTLAVKWPYWRAKWLSTWHFIGCHLSNKSFCQISALLELSWSTVSAVIVKWKCLGATKAQPRSDKPHKLTERDRRVLKREAHKHHLYSLAKLTIEFQTSSVSKITVCRELHEIGFNGRRAVHG